MASERHTKIERRQVVIITRHLLYWVTRKEPINNTDTFIHDVELNFSPSMKEELNLHPGVEEIYYYLN